MSPTLIGLSGLARSGKGSCAAVFQEETAVRSLRYHERQLSGQGKRHLANIFQPGITESQAIEFFEELKAVPNATVEIRSHSTRQENIYERVSIRKFMQHGIQDIRDSYDANFWTNLLLPKVDVLGRTDITAWYRSFSVNETTFDPADVCVVSDVRQENEAKRIQDLGGIVIECVHPMSDVGDAHITEQDLPGEVVDYTLVNDSTLEAWQSTCRAFFNQTVLPKVMYA